MELEKLKIDGIPAIIWGEPSDRIIVAAHGSHSSKTDDCIRRLAHEAAQKGCQTLSFDLPKHGERADEPGFIMPDGCARELGTMYAFAANRARSVSLFGCSMGAYFELLAFADAGIDRALFLSPVTDMERVIRGLMDYCGVTEDGLREKVLVENDFEPLYYPYFEYVKTHPITKWPHKTYILRGENDTTAAYDSVKSFADRFGCELTVQPGGEHWFHTASQLDYFGRWLEKRL